MKERNTYRERGEGVCVREEGGEQWRKKIKKEEGARKLSQNQLPKQTTCKRVIKYQ